MRDLTMRPIGVVRSPFKTREGAPIQPPGAREALGRVELLPEYAPALADLDGFSHLILLYHFHLSQGWQPLVKPFLDDTKRGLFATRAPRRPNPIGLSVVRLLGVEGPNLEVGEVDLVDGTPLLDLKPYVPVFDSRPEAAIGWMEGKQGEAEQFRADDRFSRHDPGADRDG